MATRGVLHILLTAARRGEKSDAGETLGGRFPYWWMAAPRASPGGGRGLPRRSPASSQLRARGSPSGKGERREMRIRQLAVLTVALMCTVAVATMAVAAGAGGGVTTDQLIYKGASVKTQVDVNGAAAVALVGNALDAVAAQIEQQAKAGPGEGPMAMLPMVAPMIGPAKDVIKNLERITLLIMKPKKPVGADEFISYYSGLMSPRGWSPFVTVKDEDGTGVLTMLAPEAKGVFFAVTGKDETIVGLVTTSKPMGELIGQVVSASGGAWPAIMSQIGKGKPAPKPEKEAEAAESEGK